MRVLASLVSETPVQSMPPAISAACRVLVLGSMPGARSLALQQYYGHPRNRFWWYMELLCGVGPALAYPLRLSKLNAAGIALWDVLASCERAGSLDSAIVRQSECPNDLAGLLQSHPAVTAIALNGRKAVQVFRSKMWTRLPAERAAALRILELPSTSPANASISDADKCAAWLQLKRYIDATCGRDEAAIPMRP